MSDSSDASDVPDAWFWRMERGELVAEFAAAPSFLNRAGHVQGGMLGTTLNLNLSFLRPAAPGALHGRARLTSRGRSVADVVAELEQGGKVVATASTVCMIISNGEKTP